MEKLKMHTPDLTQDHIARIRELFPNCVTEARDESGKLKLAVDFDQLKQELSDSIVEGSQERYHLNWPGKREALLTANAPIAKTLRPVREESVDFDTTKNLFIEGDNLEALKLLQETYLGKVKMIYIDPPYNTGNDFIYEDDFAETTEEFKLRTNQKDNTGNKLVANPETNGRFHSDWCSMIYPRIKLARNFLSDDGVLFISIDDSEVQNLRKICDEIFGEENFLNQIALENDSRARPYGSVSTTHEYILAYRKSDMFMYEILLDEEKEFSFSDDEGGYDLYELRNRNIAFNKQNRPNLYYPFYVDPNSMNKNGLFLLSLKKENGFIEVYPQESQGVQTVWRWGKDKALENLNSILFAKKISNHPGYQIVKKYRATSYTLNTVWSDKDIKTDRGTLELKALFDNKKYFDFPKPVSLIERLLSVGSDKNSIIMDFFAGSSTTAHAVLQYNAKEGGNRNFVMVQLPELTDEKSEAYKAGYKSIAEISKERIRRAGRKAIEGQCHESWNKDIGFRVLKIDTSNMAEVYYTPDAVKQDDLLAAVDNIRPDRSPEDFLFQVLLDWGVDLTLPIAKKTMQGKTIFFVDGNALVACFDAGITEELVKELAAEKPLRVVFRDNGFASDSVKINADQIFKQMSPGTDMKSI